MSVILALPSKGRMKSDCDRFFANKLGLTITADHGGRGYHDQVSGRPEISVRRLPASLIAEACLEGSAHFGVTGLDLIAESDHDYDRATKSLGKLGFGKANLVVAIPNFWLDIDRVCDLQRLSRDVRRYHNRRMKIATKYKNLTMHFFEQHGITDYQIVDSQGATEATPANHLADLIVDITSSGETLSANHLKTITDGLILRSEAHLWESKRANWTPSAIALREELTKDTIARTSRAL